MHSTTECMLTCSIPMARHNECRYETVTVPLTDHDLERKARSLARHVSQTGGAPWEKLLSGITKRSNVLGAASTPPIEHAEWFTRIMNLP